jgi:probable phosphoglycerate mutase
MELVLVRHALPVRVDATHDGSPADPGLSPLGVQQAERLVDALRGDRVDAVYTSPARRAVETAAPLLEALGLDPAVEPGLAEFDADHSSYVPVEELRAAGDPRWELLLKGELYVAGVDPDAFRKAVVDGVERIAARHPGGRAVLVMHAGSINAWGGHVLGQQRALWFGPAYCSVSRFAAGRDGRRSVVSLNETAHVRDLL